MRPQESLIFYKSSELKYHEIQFEGCKKKALHGTVDAGKPAVTCASAVDTSR
jgi:hypothetical protein